MQHHPHVHCIVPAVALDAGGDRLTRPARGGFLVHYRPLADRFRSRLHTALKDGHPDFFATLTPRARRALAPATRWNVHLGHVGRGVTALRYLARYARRSAFSPKRLLGYDARGNILLRWKSSATGKTGVLRLHPHEFIRRWLLHVLPKGFTRIRHYGFRSSAATRVRLRIRLLLGAWMEPPPRLPELEPFRCGHCGGALTFLREIARPHPKRGAPPRRSLKTCA